MSAAHQLAGRTAIAHAFEHLGRIRERYTELQSLAADIEDDDLSRHLVRAMTVNTLAIRRANDLLQLEKTTGLHDADLAVSTSWRPEGDRS